MNNTETRVLGGFKFYGSLTVAEAMSRCHTTELRKVVSNLKAKGYDIDWIWEDHEGGRHKRFILKGAPESDS